MENGTTPAANFGNHQSEPGENKPKRQRVSLDEWIARFRLAFTNGQLPEILPAMQTVGYSAETLQGLLSDTDNLVALNQKQKKEYGEQYEEAHKFETLRIEIDAAARSHRALMKITLKSDIKNQTVLRLNERLKTAYAAWEQNVENFYAQLKASPQLLALANKVGITQEIADAQLEKLSALRSLKKNHRKELAEAQAATETRDKAFDELYPKYREFVDYAQIVLSDNQLLESLGIVVKR